MYQPYGTACWHMTPFLQDISETLSFCPLTFLFITWFFYLKYILDLSQRVVSIGNSVTY